MGPPSLPGLGLDRSASCSLVFFAGGGRSCFPCLWAGVLLTWPDGRVLPSLDHLPSPLDLLLFHGPFTSPSILGSSDVRVSPLGVLFLGWYFCWLGGFSLGSLCFLGSLPLLWLGFCCWSFLAGLLPLGCILYACASHLAWLDHGGWVFWVFLLP